MIDWNLEEQKAITNKQQQEANLQAKKETERQQKIEQQLQLEKNIPIFDQVIQEELENLNSYFKKYIDYDITVEKGHINIKKYFERSKNGTGYTWQDIYCTNSATEDVAEWTRKRLIDIAMHYTVNYR
jgi:hypothetical protein